MLIFPKPLAADTAHDLWPGLLRIRIKSNWVSTRSCGQVLKKLILAQTFSPGFVSGSGKKDSEVINLILPVPVSILH